MEVSYKVVITHVNHQCCNMVFAQSFIPCVFGYSGTHDLYGVQNVTLPK